MKTVLEVLNLTTDYFAKKGFDRSRKQAQEVLSFVFKIAPLELYMNYDKPVSEEELAFCREVLARRCRGEPMQYIRGSVEFYSCEIVVNEHVLIPRNETEILVGQIIKELRQGTQEGKVLWDICTGSGCIGIAIKKAVPELTVVLSDLSQEALTVASNNASLNSVAVEVRHGDLFAPFSNEKVDYIVCNPPYITESEYGALEREVKEHEPKQALVSGESGLEFYFRISSEYKSYLLPNGNLWMELGTGQGDQVNALFDSCGSVSKDWSGHDRFFSLRRP